MKKVLLLLSAMNFVCCIVLNAQTPSENLINALENGCIEIRKTNSVDALDNICRSVDKSIDKNLKKALKVYMKESKKNPTASERGRLKIDSLLNVYNTLRDVKREMLTVKETPADRYTHVILDHMFRVKRNADQAITSYQQVQEINGLEDDLKTLKGEYEAWMKKLEIADPLLYNVTKDRTDAARRDFEKALHERPIKRLARPEY